MHQTSSASCLPQPQNMVSLVQLHRFLIFLLLFNLSRKEIINVKLEIAVQPGRRNAEYTEDHEKMHLLWRRLYFDSGHASERKIFRQVGLVRVNEVRILATSSQLLGPYRLSVCKNWQTGLRVENATADTFPRNDIGCLCWTCYPDRHSVKRRGLHFNAPECACPGHLGEVLLFDY